jgi:hypothetical protein
MSARQVTRLELIAAYCDTQSAERAEVESALDEITARFSPDGFVLLECRMLDSSHCGERVVLPYGGGATLQEVPDSPLSPRGFASDMSVALLFFRLEVAE